MADLLPAALERRRPPLPGTGPVLGRHPATVDEIRARLAFLYMTRDLAERRPDAIRPPDLDEIADLEDELLAETFDDEPAAR